MQNQTQYKHNAKSIQCIKFVENEPPSFNKSGVAMTVMFAHYNTFPLDAGCKLNINKTFKGPLGSLLNECLMYA